MKFELVHTGNAKVEKAMDGLFKALSPEFRYGVLRKVANLYLSETVKRFDYQYDVDRKKWKANTETTSHYKKKGLYRKKKMVRPPAIMGPNHVGTWTGTLATSLEVNFGYSEVMIGSDQPYAKTFHYGAKKGAFGVDRRGNPIPWGDIRPRRFLGRNNRIDKQVTNLIRDELANKIGLKGVNLGRDYL
jgi:phage gpG-like protein